MSEQNILATIDGVNITDADLGAYIANLPKEQQAYAAYPQFREHALKQLLAFHLYAKMAEEEKMDETDEFKAMMERARKDILAQLAINSVLKDITVTDEEMQAFYQENPQHFEKGETVHAKHIMVDSEEKAPEIINIIAAGISILRMPRRNFPPAPPMHRVVTLASSARVRWFRSSIRRYLRLRSAR